METSTFTFDAWDEVVASLHRAETSGSSSAPSPSAVASTPSTQSSGEFQPFSLIGSVLAGGSSKKTFSLCLPSTMEGLCLGMISGTKFCLKDDSCSVASHAKKFSPSGDTFYIKELDSKAWCKPAYAGASLSSKQRLFLLSQQLARAEWDETFLILQQGLVPDWIKNVGAEKLWASSDAPIQEPDQDATAKPDLQLTSPKLANTDTGLFQLIPALSYDSVEIDPSSASDEVMTQVVTDVNSRFRTIKSKWSTAFSEIEAGYLVVINDIRQLQGLLSSVVTNSDSQKSVWQRLEHVSSQVAATSIDLQAYMTSTATNLNTVSTQCDKLHASMQIFENEALLNNSSISERLAVAEKQLQAYESRFARLLPLLQSLSRSSVHPSSNDNPLYREEFQDLQKQVELLSSKLASRPALGSPDLALQVTTLQAQVKLLQQRIVGDGVQIGAKVFQSFDDLRAWIPLKLPNRRYGLFVDAVSLLDFFTAIGHVDAEQTFTSYYSQKRTGFTSMYEARVAASVQNLFPMVFGKSESAGLDTSDKLPALSDPDKWDNGATGLKYQILRGMSDVEYQLESAVDSILGDYDEARQLAKECLFKSKRFVMELCNFMTQDYHKWRYRGHSKVEAWKMTAVSVRRIFEEMHSERVVARDGYDQEDQEFSAAKFLWATFKAHAVMAKYLKHQFYEHPSIAAVLARHLADNYVKPDDGLESRIRELEKKVDRLISKHADKKRENQEQQHAHKGAGDHKAQKNDKGRQSPQVPP
jgi:hypothetical protein